MLKSLFTSNTRIKIFEIYFKNPQEEYFIRELTRLLDEQINSVRRELDNLKNVGFLRSRMKNRKKYYYVNSNFVFYHELKSIFNKNTCNTDQMVKKLQKLGDFEIVAFAGIFLGKEAAIDLLLVGKLDDRNALEHYIENEINLSQPIKFSVLSKEDFIYRVKCNDKFVTEIISDKENILAVNKFNINI
jgi:hypothetical protein